jgi:hypothetical protein
MDDIDYSGGNSNRELNKLLDFAAREPIDLEAPWVWRQIWATLKSTTQLGLNRGVK